MHSTVGCMLLAAAVGTVNTSDMSTTQFQNSSGTQPEQTEIASTRSHLSHEPIWDERYRFPLHRGITQMPIELESDRGGPNVPVSWSMCDETASNDDYKCAIIDGFPAVAYHADLQIGSEHSTVRLVVDTGSSNLAVAGAQVSYVPGIWTFDPDTSTTALSLNKGFEVNYVEGHISGQVFRDGVALTSGGAGNYGWSQVQANRRLHRLTGAIQADVGVIQSQEKFYQTLGVNGSSFQYDGILGLGFASIATAGMRPFFDDLVSQTNISNMFGLDLCTGREWYQNSSAMTIGRPPAAISKDLTYTPLVKESYYAVFVLGMSIDGSRLPLSCSDYNSPSSSIVDSGTTNLIVPHKVFDSIVAALLPYLPEQWTADEKAGFFGGDRSIARPLAEKFPRIGIFFPLDGNETMEFEVSIYWENYLRDLGPNKDNGINYYLFSVTSMCVKESGVTLGSPLMTATYLLFDRENQRIGFLNKGKDGCGADINVSLPRQRDILESCSPTLGCPEDTTVPILEIVMFSVGGVLFTWSGFWSIWNWKCRKNKQKNRRFCCKRKTDYSMVGDDADVDFFGAGDDNELHSVGGRLDISTNNPNFDNSLAEVQVDRQNGKLTLGPRHYEDVDDDDGLLDDGNDDVLISY